MRPGRGPPRSQPGRDVHQGTRGIAGAMADASLASVAVAFRKTTPNADYMTNPDCKPYNNATRPMALDCVAIVTYQTTYRPITPIISSLVFGGGVTLTAEIHPEHRVRLSECRHPSRGRFPQAAMIGPRRIRGTASEGLLCTPSNIGHRWNTLRSVARSSSSRPSR